MQHKSLAHTLDEALARLQDETELEQYLESCPDDAQALQPLLDVARMLKHEAHQDLPADMHEWLTTGREEITTLTPRLLSPTSRRALPPIDKPPSTTSPAYGAVPILQRLSQLNPLSVAIVFLGILLFFFTTSLVHTTSARSVPGDMLYPWKLARETVTLAITPDPEQRSLLRVHYASQRIAEFETLVTNEQPTDEDQMARALDLLDVQVHSALNEARHGGNSDVVQQQLETLLTDADTRIESAMVQSQTQHDQKQQTLQSAREKVQTLKQDLPRLAVATALLDATPTPTVTNTLADPAAISTSVTVTRTRTPVPTSVHGQTTPTPTSGAATTVTSTTTIAAANPTLQAGNQTRNPTVRTETATSTTTRTARPTLSPTITRMDINNMLPTSTSSPSPTQTSILLDRRTPSATTTQVPDDQSFVLPTLTATGTATPLSTRTPTATRMPMITRTPTATPSDTVTPTATPSDTTTPTATPSDTATPTATPSDTATPTATPSDTALPTATPSNTALPTATPSNTALPTATPSNTALPTATPSNTALPTATPSNTATPRNTATPSNTATPRNTATPTPSHTATPSHTTTPTPRNTATPTPSHTTTPTPFETNISGAVRPILECVAVSTDDWLIAFFGYENLSDAPVVIPIGRKNTIIPGQYDGLQPEEFVLPAIIEDRPGRTGFYPDGPFAFTLTFRATEQVIWTLDGRTATASRDSPQCGVLLDATTTNDLPTTDTPAPEAPLVDPDLTSTDSE